MATGAAMAVVATTTPVVAIAASPEVRDLSDVLRGFRLQKFPPALWGVSVPRPPGHSAINVYTINRDNEFIKHGFMRTFPLQLVPKDDIAQYVPAGAFVHYETYEYFTASPGCRLFLAYEWKQEQTSFAVTHREFQIADTSGQWRRDQHLHDLMDASVAQRVRAEFDAKLADRWLALRSVATVPGVV